VSDGGGAAEAGTVGTRADAATSAPPIEGPELYPLKEGRSWTFTGQFRYIKDSYVVRVLRATRDVGAVDPSGRVGERMTFEMESEDAPGFGRGVKRDPHVIVLTGRTHGLSFDGGKTISFADLFIWPSKDGEVQPDTGVGTYTWKQVGKFTVLAGTFDDCWTCERRDDGNRFGASSTFCKGVGLVKLENGVANVDSAYNRYELSDKNF